MSTLTNKSNDDDLLLDDVELNDDEIKGLKLIRENNRIHQSEFWKKLDIHSKKGSRIAKKLDDEGLIQREKTIYDGHNTYLLKPIYKAKNLNFSLLMAGTEISPFIGEDNIDYMSDAFTSWLMILKNEYYGLNN